MKSSPLKTNLFFKIGSIVVIILLLLIPTGNIQGLITERESRQQEAIDEVSAKWGEAQYLTGPFISIPYYRYEKEPISGSNQVRIIKHKDYYHLLPESLKAQVKLKPQKRSRGIYEVVVYDAQLQIEGTFEGILDNIADIPQEDLMIDKAVVVFGISDLKAIEEQVSINWNDNKYAFNPGVPLKSIVGSGVQFELNLKEVLEVKHTFSLEVALKGSKKIMFAPVGKTTDINMESDWSNPSFTGAFLPDSRKVESTGFSANWNILHLNRNFPQAWINNNYGIEDEYFGVDLLLPVDSYQKSSRAIKYAILFVVLTFMVFFFIEVLNHIFIHPIQYILVGLALVLFFTLLLSISEHISFDWAYICAAMSTLILVAMYVKAIIKSTPLSLVVTGILSTLYAFIFVVIQLQDLALLIGSIGLFVILSLVMYFSRKIDWYAIQGVKQAEKEA
jgi:inner membrane protein